MFFKKDKKTLAKVINSILLTNITADDITFISNEENGTYLQEKTSVLDLKITLPNKKVILIEMQKANAQNLYARSSWYVSRTSSKNLLVGNDYFELGNVYGIFFLAEDSKEFPRLFTNLIECDKMMKEEYGGYTEKYFINLTRLDENKIFDGEMMKFLKYMSLQNYEEMEEMARNSK